MVRDLGCQVEDALGTGQFDLAQFLFSQYTRLVDDQLDEAHSSLEAPIISEALDTMKRWLSIARVVRGHLCEELRLVACEQSYAGNTSNTSILELVG